MKELRKVTKSFQKTMSRLFGDHWLECGEPDVIEESLIGTCEQIFDVRVAEDWETLIMVDEDRIKGLRDVLNAMLELPKYEKEGD